MTFETSEVHDLPRDLSGYDCPDHAFRPERPGGCEHRAALRQALPTAHQSDPPAPAPLAVLVMVARSSLAPASVAAVALVRRPALDRTSERDEATMPVVPSPT
jgi:hypothetical protein